MKHILAAAISLNLLAGMLPAPVSALEEPIPPYIIEADNVMFTSDVDSTMFNLIVSSNEESSVFFMNNGCAFMPYEDGRFVVSTREYYEKNVECTNGHFHYFYPVVTNYTVDVENGEISVQYMGEKSWYSEEEINAEREVLEAREGAVSCYDVYAGEPDDVLNKNLYYTFVNGQLRGDENGYDSYIMNVYKDYGTDSYFCVNYESRDVQQDMYGNEPQRVTALEMDISSLITHFFTSSTCDGNLEMPSPDIKELSRIAAPMNSDEPSSVDGGSSFPLNVVVDGEKTYRLTVDEGIFHIRKDKIMGDCNLDGKLSILDAIMLQKYLLCNGTLTAPECADVLPDDVIDGFDLAVLERRLMEIGAF